MKQNISIVLLVLIFGLLAFVSGYQVGTAKKTYNISGGFVNTK